MSVGKRIAEERMFQEEFTKNTSFFKDSEVEAKEVKNTNSFFEEEENEYFREEKKNSFFE